MPLNPNTIGALLGLASAMFMGVRILFVRKATVTGKPFDALYISICVCVAIFVPGSLIMYFPNFDLTLKSLLVFLLVGVIGTIIATSLYFVGTKRLGASVTAPVRNASLLVTVVIALFLLGESATFAHIAGIFLILIGVVIVARKISGDRSGSISEKYSLDLLLPIGAMIGFGLADSLIKIGLSEKTPVWLGIAIMHSISLLILSGYYLWKGDSLLDPFLVEENYLYLGAGLSLAGGLVSLFLGLNIADLVVVIPLKSLAPLFVLILSYSFMRRLEIINKTIILGTALIVSGTILIGAFM